MTGHAGSTAAHPVVLKSARALKARLPSALIVYGGVFPTYHAEQICVESRQSISLSAAKAKEPSRAL